MAKLKDTRVYGNLDIDSVLTVTKDTTINGNLTVTGNTVYSYVDTMKITDPLIELGGADGADLSSNDGKDRGTWLHYYDGAAKNAFMGWDNSAGEFALGSDVTVSNEVVSYNAYGNLHAGVFIGNAAGLTAIPGANVTGTVAYANVSSYAGIVTASNQPNITNVGTLTTLTVGNSTANTVFGNGTVNASGDVHSGGNLTVSGYANITGDLTVTGTIHANVSGTLTAPGSTTQVLFNDAGSVNAISGFTFDKSTHALSVSGNITGDTITGNAFSGSGAGLSSITGANVTGYVANATHATTADTANAVAGSNVSGQVGNAIVAGTVYTNAQPNITSVGTLTTLTVSGNIEGGNVTSDGFLQVTGNANVGNIGAASGVLTGTLSVTGNANVGNLGTGAVIASANVDAANFNTTGTANIGNLKIAGEVHGNLIPDANVTFNLGNAAYRWKDLYLSGSSIYLGDQVLESNSTSLITSADFSAGNLRATVNTYSGNVYANSGMVKATDLEGTLTVASHAQPNITSVGTLISLTVTGNASAGNVAGGNLVSANYISGNGSLLSSITGANVTGNVANAVHAFQTDNANTAGTVTASAQPNITSTGTLTSLTVTGTASAGDFSTGGNLTATGNVTAAKVTTTTVVATTADIAINAADTNGNVKLTPTGTGTVDVSSKRITSVAEPTAASDAATKGYVDGVAQGLSIKDSVRVATHTALDAAYLNGTSGDGATLISTASEALLVDGHSTANGDRVLVKDQENALENGIYVVTNAGSGTAPWVLTRASDMNSTSEVYSGFVFVTDGYYNKNTGWAVSVTDDAFKAMGTDDILFTQFSGAGTYTAADGVTLTGTEFTAHVDGSTIDTTSSGALHVKDGLTLVTPNIGAATGTSLVLGTSGSNITTSGGNLTATGNITASNFVGTLHGDVVGNISGTLVAPGSNTYILFNDGGTVGGEGDFVYDKSTNTLTVGNISGITNVSATTLAGNLTTAAQPNITSVGTLSSVTVSGDITAQANVNVTSTVTAAHFSGNGSAISSITGANVTGYVPNADHATIANTANVALSITGSNVSGDVSGANHANVADVANLVAGANVTGFVANATLATHVTAADQANITSVGTLTGLTVSANVTTGGIKTDNYYYANGAAVDFNTAAGNAGEIQFKGAGSDLDASANFKFNSSTNVLTVTGNISGANVVSATTVTATNLTGTLTTAAQPNVTSVGTLTSLTVGGVSTLGAIGNVKITGGTDGQYLKTDGTGSLSWSTINTSKISNGTSNVSVALDGNITLTSAGNAVITVSGLGANVTGYIDVTGNINSANINTGIIVANANVVSNSSITGTVKVTGGIGATGNIYTGKAVGFANNNGGTDSAAYIQFNATANSLDFIFN